MKFLPDERNREILRKKIALPNGIEMPPFSPRPNFFIDYHFVTFLYCVPQTHNSQGKTRQLYD
jgi:hypothetical protein